MDIYHTKKQTESTPRPCSNLLMKTLFYFISQCTSVPYFESGVCKFDKKLDNCNFTYTGLFSLHIERPSYMMVQWVRYEASLRAMMKQWVV